MRMSLLQREITPPDAPGGVFRPSSLGEERWKATRKPIEIVEVDLDTERMFVYYVLAQMSEFAQKGVLMMVRTRKGLTERHQRILDYLNACMRDQGYPPSIREIGKATGISSTSVVTYYLKQLADMGLIERDAKFSRALRLPNAGQEMVRVPILGTIAAGEPILVPDAGVTYIGDEIDAVDVARSILPGREKGDRLYALKVKGDSMIDAMIHDGDIVIMKPAVQASNGEMVAIWLPDRGETTLKYFFKEGEQYRLQPANPTMKPIIIGKDEPLEIRGKVVMVIRKIEKTPL
jgi:repressor LexA